jgi:hypothetical protein
MPATAPPSTAGQQFAPAAAHLERAFLTVLAISGCSFIAAVALILFFAVRH